MQLLLHSAYLNNIQSVPSLGPSSTIARGRWGGRGGWAEGVLSLQGAPAPQTQTSSFYITEKENNNLQTDNRDKARQISRVDHKTTV